MSVRDWEKDTITKVNPLSSFTVRVLSVGRVELDIHDWFVPKSQSLYWSIYIPEVDGLELGKGKGAAEVPKGSIGIVPQGASAARNNSTELDSLFLHFDLGGLAGLQLAERLDKIGVISSDSFQSQIAEIDQALRTEDVLRLQLCVQELISGALADYVSETPKKRAARSWSSSEVHEILPAVYAIEERLTAPTYRALKISEMAALCELKPVDFSRIFFQALGVNPAEYAQRRRIATSVQQLLFTDKSIDEVSASMSFANRFYFSRMFKDAVGVTPAAYRNAFRRRH